MWRLLESQAIRLWQVGVFADLNQGQAEFIPGLEQESIEQEPIVLGRLKVF